MDEARSCPDGHSPNAPPPGRGRILAAHLPELAAGAFVLLLFSWLLTQGSWRFFETEPQGSFYDAQAKSFLQGRWDVPHEAIGNEAFTRDGKHYGYFGPTPALFRLPLMALFPGSEGRWTRLSLLFGSLANLILAALLFRAVGKGGQEDEAGAAGGASSWPAALFVLLAGLGSTNIFLASRAFVYHEAAMWGNTFALASYLFLGAYFVRPRMRSLAGAGLAAALAFFTRGSCGLGPLLAGAVIVLFLLFQRIGKGPSRSSLGGFLARQRDFWNVPSPARPAPPLLLLSGAGLLVVCGFLAHNYGKFGHPLNPFPVEMNEQYRAEPERLRRMQGRSFHLANAAVTAPNYLSPGKIEINRRFPWLHLTREVTYPVPVATFDYTQYFAGFPAAMPALCLLALFGLGAVFRGKDPLGQPFRLPLAGAFVSGAMIFFFVAIDYRYQHDFYPFLLLSGAAGLKEWTRRPPGRGRTAFLSALAFLALYSGLANVAFAYEYQRAIVWQVPEERRASLREIRAAFAAWLDEKPLRPVRSDFDAWPEEKSEKFVRQMAEVPVAGRLWAVRWHAQTSLYYFNGKAWTRVAGRPLFVFRVPLRVLFGKASGAEPLLFLGAPESGVSFYVRYGPGGTLRYGGAVAGLSGREGPPLAVKPGRPCRVEIRLDVLNRAIRLTADGAVALELMAPLKLFDARRVRLGLNGSATPAAGARFSGRIETLDAPARVLAPHRAPP